MSVRRSLFIFHIKCYKGIKWVYKFAQYFQINLQNFWCWQIFAQYFTKKDRGYRASPLEVFLEKGVLKICSQFTGEHPRRSVISIKMLLLALKLLQMSFCIYKRLRPPVKFSKLSLSVQCTWFWLWMIGYVLYKL